MLKIVKVIIQIGLLFCMYFIGTWIQQAFSLFIPGSVIGLVLMFILLSTGILRAQWIESGARFMMNHLVLFFIPATVGLLNYYHLFAGKGIFLVIITMVSTFIVMVASGLISESFAKRKDLNNE
ncbi:CidA/LrgA family protein [Pseudogracilibacillus auburnensis]|uniref:CidA/LrgA family protein n=1 Tax=Pseudogracilibacillus auburnensis TaxID=1494959 RepID=UPI001A95F43E|nr:CidA/LrgA family holin-like protein [Pseudogracilibacillus auburnensis]MBO1002221.1 CidA/LrgA family holin-like protein [Pseudogracilibacillus auburnensis]